LLSPFRPKKGNAFFIIFTRTIFTLSLLSQGVAQHFNLLPLQGKKLRAMLLKAFPHWGEREGGFV
jgi:hypothetical protein